MDAEALSAVLLDAVAGMRNLGEMEIHTAGIATPEPDPDFELLCYRFRLLRTLKFGRQSIYYT